MQILLLEDDKYLGRATEKGLKTQFTINWVISAEAAIATISY
jgi:hypothetical protein